MEFSPAVTEKAQRLHAEGRVSEMTGARVFPVIGDSGDRYLVVVDGDGGMTCSCPATVPCKHLGAALIQLRTE